MTEHKQCDNMDFLGSALVMLIDVDVSMTFIPIVDVVAAIDLALVWVLRFW